MPLAGAWVNRWQVSPPPLPPLPPFPHLQSFVSLRYRTFLLGTENAVGGMGLWLSMPSCFLREGLKFSLVKVVFFQTWGGGSGPDNQNPL